MNMPDLRITDRFKEKLWKGIQKRQRIVFVTRLLEDSGEAKIRYITETLLERYNQIDLLELVYTACKEFVMNSTKAAIKRIVFDDIHINGDVKEADYVRAMKNFKESILFEKFLYFKDRMRKEGLHTRIEFKHSNECLVLKVSNNFPLFKSEEVRIREKFQIAKNYNNLPEFFIAHGDESEGTGLGIALVGILMSQSGLDRRLLTIYTMPKTNFTVARLEIPFVSGYKSKRMLFEEEFLSGKFTRERTSQKMEQFRRIKK